MSVEITTLVENSQGEHTGLQIEHGLSFLIETDQAKILFDTGRSEAFIHNAEKLNKDLHTVSHVVLSHGHYDHSGGFRSFVNLEGRDAFTLYTGAGFFVPKYARFNASYQYLGNDFDEQFLLEKGIENHTVSKKELIAPSVWVITDFIRPHREETIHPRFVLKDGEGWQPDLFTDEVSVVVETEKGLVVIVGCSHPGILNMLDTVNGLFDEKIYAVLGGTHLVEADHARTVATMRAFAERKIEVLGISHCSGPEAIALAIENSSIHFHNKTGSSLIL